MAPAERTELPAARQALVLALGANRTLFNQLADRYSRGFVERIACPLNEPDIIQRRQEVERGLRLANTLGLGLVLVVVALAIFALVMAQRSFVHAQRVGVERLAAEEQLYQASIAQIQAQRLAGQLGQRTRSLEAVRIASQVQRSPELREQAVAALALADLEELDHWVPFPKDAASVVADERFTRCAFVQDRTNIVVLSLADPKGARSFSPPDWRDPSIQLSRDGRFLLAWSSRMARVWEVEGGRLRFEWKAQAGNRIRSMGLDPRGSRLALTDELDLVRVFDFETQQELLKYSGLSNVWQLAFHPVQDRLAVENENKIRILDWGKGIVADSLDYQNSGTSMLAWRQDGAFLAAGRFDGMIDLWDLSTHSHPTRRLSGHTREVVRVMFHPGGLLVSYSWDNTMRLWDTLSGAQLLASSGVLPVGFTLEDPRLVVWRSPGEIGTLKLHLPSICRTLDPDSRRPRRDYTMEFTRDSKQMLVSDDLGFWIVDVPSGRTQLFQSWPGCTTANFLPDGSILTLTDEGLQHWPVARGENGVGWSAGPPRQVGGKVHGDAGLSSIDPTGARIVFHISNLGHGEIRDVQTGKTLVELRGNFDFSGPKFSPDGRWVASGSWNPTVTKRMFATVWDAANGRVVRQFPTLKCSVRFSPDGRLLVLSSQQECQLIRTGTWDVQQIFKVSGSMVDNGDAAFSPDGRILALRATDRVLRLVDLSEGRELTRLNAPGQPIVRGLQFSPDAQWLAVGTDNGIRLWDLAGLRSGLREFGLDWRVAGEPETRSPGFASSAMVISGPEEYSSLIASLILAGVAGSVAMAFWLRRYQRRVLESYAEVEALTARRGEQLALAHTELMHSQKMRALGTLASGIAHDFNNLLSVIRMSNGLIARESRNRPSILENVDEIEHAVKQGKSVVRTMLGHGHGHGGEDAAQPGPVCVPQLVEDVVGLLSREFLSGIALSLELDRAVPAVEISSARLEQAVLNLLVNASEAMNNNGRLCITVRTSSTLPQQPVLKPRAAEAYVELSVGDSGPGIDPEILPRIFEPFFTTKTTGTNRGTGLGLSLLYTVARDEGLGLSVETSPGNGAVFTLWIPSSQASSNV